jgi:hypothetical protein
MRRYIGLAIQWFGGLDTLKREPSLRAVQIMRQTISNLETGNSLSPAYHANKGLSRALKNQGIKKDKRYPYWHNKPYIRVWGLCGYIGLGFEGLKV